MVGVGRGGTGQHCCCLQKSVTEYRVPPVLTGPTLSGVISCNLPSSKLDVGYPSCKDLLTLTKM